MVEKTGKTEIKKKTKTSKKEESVVKKVKVAKRKIDGTKAAYANAISLVLSLTFGIVSICLGISYLTGWEFFGSNFLMFFEYPELVFGIFSVVCAGISIFSVNKITDKKAFEKIWGILYKIFFGLGIFEAINVVSIVVFALIAISPESGVNQGDLWINQFLSCFVMFLLYLGIAFLAKKIIVGKTVLVRIFGIVSAFVSVIGFVLVLIGLLVNLYGEGIEQKNYSDYYGDEYSDGYGSGTDIEDLYENFFMNPFGF